MPRGSKRVGNRIVIEKLVRCVVPVAAASLGARIAVATPAQWDGDSAVGVAGDGISWTSAANWTSSGIVDSLPPNTAPGDDLTFGGGTVGTINLGGNEIANSLNFTAGFTLDPPSNSDTLTLSTATVTVSTGISAAINVKLSESHGITLAGAGTLTLGNSANSISGTATINGGTLVVGASSALGSAVNATVGTGAGIVFNGNTSFSGVTTNSGTFSISSGDTVTMNSFSSTFDQNGGQLVVGGTLNCAGSAFSYAGGNITGTVSIGVNSFAPQLMIGTGAGNSGVFAIGGEGVTLTSNTTTVSIQSNQVLNFTPTTTTSTGALSTTDVLVNAGNITVAGAAMTRALLHVGTGSMAASSTLTNSGTITMAQSSPSGGTADFIIANIFNTTGTLDFNASTQVTGNIQTGGGVDIASGNTVNFANTSNSFEIDSGSLTIEGTLSMPSNLFDYNGGSVIGTVSLGGSALGNLSLPSTSGNSGTFLVGGLGVLVTGDSGSPVQVHSGITITLQLAANGGQIETTQNLVNGGAINVTGSSTSTASLNCGTNTITNNGTITTAVTSAPNSVADFIVASQFTNTATTNINASTQFSGNVTNSGAFNIASTATTTFSAGLMKIFTQSGGSLTVNGVLVMGGDNFTYTGGNITGTVGIGALSTAPTLTFGAGAGNSGNFLFGGAGGSISGSIPSGVTVTFQPGENGNLSFSAGFVNQGTLNVTDGATMTATLTGNATITNSGIMTTSGAGSLTTAGNLVSGILANSSTGTLNVDASLEMLNNPIANNGTINIASGAAILLGSVSAEFKQSGGQIEVAPGGLLDTRGSTIFLTSGTITLDAGALTQGVFKPGFVEYSASSTMTTIQSSAVLGVGKSPGFVDLSGNQDDFAIGSGTLPVQVLVSAPIRDGALEKSGSGVLEISGANTYAGGTTVTNGTLLVGAANSIPTSGGITIETGGTVKLAPGIGGPTTQSLAIDSTSRLDLTNNHLFINYSGGVDPIGSIASLLSTGYASGAWNGPGIMSSTVAAGYGIGYADSADPGNPAGLSSQTIEVKYTLLGDTDLNGIVNGIDFGIVAANFNQGVSRWDQGDFDYSGIVNGIDFGDLAANFNQGASGAADWAQLMAFAQANGLMADVPEPASIGLIATAGIGLLARRRRRICKSPPGA